MLCFGKLAGEHNKKNTFKFFVLWEDIIFKGCKILNKESVKNVQILRIKDHSCQTIYQTIEHFQYANSQT